MVSIATAAQPLAGMTPTLPPPSLKRALSGDHDDQHYDHRPPPSAQPPPAKRSRVVMFDPDVEVRILEEWTEKGMDLVREEARHAVRQLARGDASAAEQIRLLFVAPQQQQRRAADEDAVPTALLRKYVIALAGCVGQLDRRCEGLVHAVLEFPWLVRDESFVVAYTRFLGSLVSAQGGYTRDVLRSVVYTFVEVPSPSLRHRDDPLPRRSQMLSRAHQSLKYILSLIPTASSALSTLLSSYFPDPSDSGKIHVQYVKNLLQLIEYAPELKGEVLALITERLVKIDVQIQVDMEELEDDLDEHTIAEILDQDEEDDTDQSDTDSDTSEESLEPEELRIKELKESVSKMDAILDIMFDYYHPIFANGNQFDVDNAFQALLSQFDNTIIPTYRSRHTQFLLFHFSQSSPHLVEHFAGVLSHFAFDQSRPQLIRLAAAAYLASYIARGAHIPKAIVRDVFDLLGRHLERLRVTHEPSCTVPDLRRYGSFYAIAQALLYVFCFRWRDLISNTSADDDEEADADDVDEQLDALHEGRDFAWAPGVKDVLSRSIYSRLNPLKVCSPAIVAQFARIAHHLRFLYVFPLLETNKRLRLSRSIASVAMHRGAGAGAGGEGVAGVLARETALSGKSDDRVHQLDAYFPFDPYQLPRSKRWLAGDYNEWRGVPGLDNPAGAAAVEDASDSESESDGGGGEGEFEEATLTDESA